MPTEIDSLQISINAKAQTANRQIDALVGRLDVLEKSLGKVNGLNYGRFSSGMDLIANSAKKFNVNDAKAISSIANSLEKFKRISPSSLSDIGNKLMTLSVGVSSIANVGNLSDATKAINAIKNISSVNTRNFDVDSFRNIGIAVKDFASSLSSVGNVDKGIVSLVNSITRLSASGKNIQNVSREFPVISNNILDFVNKLNGLNISFDINGLGNLIGNIRNLGGKVATNAISTIPQLANALKYLMTTLSTAPQVSSNVVAMANALANLSANGSKVGSASKSIARGLNTVNNSATRARSSFGGLASAIGRFYASYFLIIRAFKGLWKSINSTADYVEAFNYFTVSMGKVASKWDEKWSQYADQNAKNYSNTFFTTLTKSFEKLSGISYNPETGLLSETGLKNLGLNLREVTQYAAQLSSMMDAVGQSGETTLATTNAFVKLAGDISSLYNIDYQNAADKIRSVLQGQSRAGYGFGWDTTMAALQSEADRLDLSKAVSEMSQMEKQQLRILTILDQSRVAWGDQSNTINTLANQIRIFKNNISETSMVLGQLFVPILSKLMPIINGITIAIKRLLSSIAGLLGLELGDTGQGFSDLGEDMEDVADGFGDATNAAKKFKAQLLGIDEINNLTSGNAGGGAGGIAMNTIDLTEQIKKATEEYEKAWNEAYKRMQNKAEEIADKIKEFFEPITKPFEDLDWETITTNLTEFLEALKPWEENFGKGFIEFWGDLANIGATALEKLFGEEGAIKGLTDFLNNNDPEKAQKWGYAFGALSLGIMAILGALGISGTIATSSKILSFMISPISKLITLAKDPALLVGLSTALKYLVGLWGLFNTDLGLILGAGTAMEIGLTIGAGLIAGFLAACAGFEGGKLIGEKLFPEDAEYYKNFKWFGEGGFFGTIFEDLEATLFSVITMWKDFSFMGLLLDAVLGKENVDLIDQKILDAFGKDGFSGIYDMFVESLTKIKDYIKEWIDDKISPMFTKEKWTGILKGFKDGFVSVFTGVITVVIGRMNKFIEAIEKMVNLGILALNKLIENINPFAPLLDFVGIDIKIKDVSLGRIPLPQYKYGGFPEDGLFMANHGELVGGFSNGKTAVANNGQIIEGIEGGVERAVSRVLAPYLEDIAQNTRETANKDFSISRKQVFNAVREESKIFKKSTGAPAFS